MPSDSEWPNQLRGQRERLGLTRSQLADTLGVPVSTLRRWEDGSRRPREARLRRLLEALEFSRADENLILELAGYSPNLASNNPAIRETWYQLRDLDRAVESVPWPAFVSNELGDMLSANGAFEALVDVDLTHEFREPGARNFLAVASQPRFARRAQNWDELISILIAIWKGSHYSPQTLDNPSLYFSNVLLRFNEGDPAYVLRFAQLWDQVPLMPNRQRWEYPVKWTASRGETINLLGLIVSSDNTLTNISFHDWIPIDATSWSLLEEMKVDWSIRNKRQVGR